MKEAPWGYIDHQDDISAPGQFFSHCQAKDLEVSNPLHCLSIFIKWGVVHVEPSFESPQSFPWSCWCLEPGLLLYHTARFSLPSFSHTHENKHWCLIHGFDDRGGGIRGREVLCKNGKQTWTKHQCSGIGWMLCACQVWQTVWDLLRSPVPSCILRWYVPGRVI